LANRLAAERSPYLRQHAENPVDWYPWGPEALERARTEDRPILLSIGYSACHWCHVMERESFEDDETAALMNRHFVSIKVDREERPDLDDVYQHAVQLLGRSGGWPLTAFLTPAGVPFYGGTYFPPEDRHGLPSFRYVLNAIAEAFRSRRAEVEASGRQMLSSLDEVARVPETPGQPTPAAWSTAVGRLLARFDWENGGFGSRPKFPNSMNLDVLLRGGALAGQATAGDAVKLALAKMADGGIHDQLGGGFHRYSTDERWLVPHFEKMLYDNALLAPLYLAAFQETGEPRWSEVARGTLDYLARDLSSPEGGFFSSEDADSEGEEGVFYLWSYAQLIEVLGAGAAELARHLGVTREGNFEEGPMNVLTRATPSDAALERGKRALFEVRSRRPRPFRDEKILAGWNGLAISAFARGAQVLGDPALLRRARAAAVFVEERLTDRTSKLLRTYCGGAGTVGAFADDHAFLSIAHLDLYESEFRPADLARARRLADALLERFFAEGDAALWLSPSDGEALVHRPRSLYDNAIPGATSAALEAWQRLGWITGEARYLEAGKAVVRRHLELSTSNPFGFGNLLCGLDRDLRGPVEVVVAGARGDPRTQALLSEAYKAYLPNRAVVLLEPGVPANGIAEALREGRGQESRPTAYVCRSGACLAPVTDPAALPDLLKEARRQP
jgi:uncharacterized protein YyaL (SSP411 family)